MSINCLLHNRVMLFFFFNLFQNIKAERFKYYCLVILIQMNPEESSSIVVVHLTFVFFALFVLYCTYSPYSRLWPLPLYAGSLYLFRQEH